MVTRRNLNAVKTDDMASDGNNLREEEDICTQRVNISGDHSYNSKGPRTRAESDAFPRAFFPSPGALPSPGTLVRAPSSPLPDRFPERENASGNAPLSARVRGPSEVNHSRTILLQLTLFPAKFYRLLF